MNTKVNTRSIVVGILVLLALVGIAVYISASKPAETHDVSSSKLAIEGDNPRAQVVPQQEQLERELKHASGLTIQLISKDKFIFDWDPSAFSYEEFIRAIHQNGSVVELYHNRPEYLPAFVSTTSMEFSPLGTYLAFSVVHYEGTREYLVNTKTGEDIIGKSLAHDHGWPLWPLDESFLVLERPGVPIDGTAPAVLVSKKGHISDLKVIHEDDDYWWDLPNLTSVSNLAIKGDTVTFSAFHNGAKKGFVYDVAKQEFVN